MSRLWSAKGREAELRGDCGHGGDIVRVRRVRRQPHELRVVGEERSFAALRASQDRFLNGGGASEIHPAISPAERDIVVTKLRVSAFAGSDLDVILRSQGVRHLVLSGIATSGVVLSTLREAADRDFGLTVLADGCLDADAEVHRVLLEKVFPRQADVVTVARWIDVLQGRGN